MKHYKKPDGSVWAYEPDGSQDDLIEADMVPCAQPVPVVVVPTKADRIRAVLGEHSRQAVQSTIAIAQLNAKVEFLLSNKAVALSMSEAYARNASVRVATDLEAACRAIEKAP